MLPPARCGPSSRESPSIASTRAPCTSRWRRRLHRHPVEVRRLAHVRDSGRPTRTARPSGCRAPRQSSSPSKTCAYFARNISGFTAVRIGVAHLRLRRPDVAQVHRLAVLARARAARCCRSMSIVPGERVRHHQRRRREVVRPHLRLHAPLEVAVARQHRRTRRGSRRGSPPRSRSGSGPLLPMHVVQP